MILEIPIPRILLQKMRMDTYKSKTAVLHKTQNQLNSFAYTITATAMLVHQLPTDTQGPLPSYSNPITALLSMPAMPLTMPTTLHWRSIR